jgi:hypothetical protein
MLARRLSAKVPIIEPFIDLLLETRMATTMTTMGTSRTQ